MIFESEKNFMALKPCRECKKKVSTEAAACPSCGAPRPTSKISIIKKEKIPAAYFSKNHGYYFWQGSEGLAKTFWLYFVGGNIVGNIFLSIALRERLEGLTYFVLLAAWAWAIFCIIGVFKAADIVKAKKIKAGETYGYSTAARVAVVLLTLSGFGRTMEFLGF